MHVNVQYPDVVLNIRDVKAAIDAGDTVGDMLDKSLEELNHNITIKDSEESGIRRREKILGINPLDTSGLEDRRFEVLMRWYDTPIYTETTLRNKLDSALGAGNYILTVDLENKTINCAIELTRKLMIKTVQDLFEQMIPLDYVLSITLRYNQYKTLKPFTYGQLKSFTCRSLRNEVISIAENS